MSKSPPFFGYNYGVSPSPLASNLRSQYKEEIDRLSKKVTTHLPDGKTAEVYTHSNMLQLAELYNDIAKRGGLDELKKRIEQIQAEHKTTSDRIGKTYGIAYLKPGKAPNSRKMRKSRKTRKTKKTRK